MSGVLLKHGTNEMGAALDQTALKALETVEFPEHNRFGLVVLAAFDTEPAPDRPGVMQTIHTRSLSMGNSVPLHVVRHAGDLLIQLGELLKDSADKAEAQARAHQASVAKSALIVPEKPKLIVN